MTKCLMSKKYLHLCWLPVTIHCEEPKALRRGFYDILRVCRIKLRKYPEFRILKRFIVLYYMVFIGPVFGYNTIEKRKKQNKRVLHQDPGQLGNGRKKNYIGIRGLTGKHALRCLKFRPDLLSQKGGCL